MAEENSKKVVNVVQIVRWSVQEDGCGLINKFMDFSILPKERAYM